jgi:hypothetical protein
MPLPPPTIKPIRKKNAILFIDCEFNNGKGELISMALIDKTGAEFYEVLPLPRHIHPWIQDNVIPILGKEPISQADFDQRLCEFLFHYENPTIIADHPADIGYFADVLVYNQDGARYDGEWTAKMVNIRYTSTMPHNALADARSLKDAYYTQLRSKLWADVSLNGA